MRPAPTLFQKGESGMHNPKTPFLAIVSYLALVGVLAISTARPVSFSARTEDGVQVQADLETTVRGAKASYTFPMTLMHDSGRITTTASTHTARINADPGSGILLTGSHIGTPLGFGGVISGYLED